MIDKYQDFAIKLEKLRDWKVTEIEIVVCVLGIFLKSLERKLEEMQIRGRIETTQKKVKRLSKFSLNSLKSPGDPKGFGITQTSGKKHQLHLVRNYYLLWSFSHQRQLIVFH